MLGARQIANREPARYATGSDFCRIFKENMNGLYLLSFLLTGNHVTAEKCFVQGLDDSGKGNRVFREWARSWARRTIIQNAIHLIRPRPTDNGKASFVAQDHSVHPSTEPAEIAAIIELPAFERFVFVMSVLERYTDRECSLLLDCAPAAVAAGRIRALQQIGRSVEHRRLLDLGAAVEPLGDTCEPARRLEAIAPLAASA